MALKQKVCKSCRNKFVPSRPMQSACSTACAIAIAERKRQKQAQQEEARKRKEARQRLEKMKGIPELAREAQTACNAYIRARDDGKPCISCGSPLSADGVGGGFDAGHFRSRGAAPHLRFHEHNIAGQCKRCNRYMAGNVSAMRVGLISRYGLEAVEALENDNSTHKWTRDELIAIRRHYIAKRKEIEACLTQ